MYKYRKNIIYFMLPVIVILLAFSFFNAYSKEYNNSIECISKEKEYYIGGDVIGIKLLATGVLVMGKDDESCPLNVGDIILEVNGEKIETGAALEEYASRGEKLSLKVSRKGKEELFEVSPKYNSISEKYRLGLWVKDSSAGVGTITLYEKDTNRFAALGHAITETDVNYILPITSGGITKTEILDIKKGVPKIPGELKGTITNETLGQIYCNTKNGIFGEITDESVISDKELIQIGKKEEIVTGKAYIYVTLEDNVKRKYEINIEKILKDENTNKNLSICITDEKLIEKTGGIVQGMSGAPIIQNGKLIGVVTHVFLENPQRGYGAFIQNMLEDMNSM